MWFRRRHRPDGELRTWGDGYLADPLSRTDVKSSASLLPTPFSIDDGLVARPPSAAPEGTRLPEQTRLNIPTEPQVRYRQTKQFKPSRSLLARKLVIGAGASKGVFAAYNLLRTQIIKRLQENSWNTVAITSTSKGSGSTLTAINLAISLAREFNYTVLLVELDLVNPAFRKFLGFKERRGIVDYLLRDVPLSDLLLNPGIDRLVVLPAGAPVTNSSELLSSPKMARLVDELKHRYERRIVLFDLPAVLANDDAMAFSPWVDCALLVVEEGETRVKEVRRALDYLRSTNILGVVINRSLHAENNI